MTVLTGSMTPGIPVGSIVLVRPVDPGTLQVGDVATYEKTPGKAVYVTHRIAKIDTSATPTRFTFKGDANRGPDINPVVPKQIRGKVWFHIPYLGAIRDGLHGKGGLTLVAMLVLAGYALSQVAAGLRERKEKQQDPAGAIDLPTDRRLVVATLGIDRLAARLALSPAEAATEWGGVLVHEDDESCTVVLTASNDDELAARLELLAGLQSGRLLVVAGPVTVAGEVTRLPVPADEDEHVQA